MTTHDPFDDLALPAERQEPRPSFARELRGRLLDALGLHDDPPPTVPLPERKPTMSTTTPARSTPDAGRDTGQIWAVVCYHDALAGIRFLVDTLGFSEDLVVTDDSDPTHVAHSELRGPEGGIVQVVSFDPDNEHLAGLAPGNQSLYVVTGDPRSVLDRCRTAGVTFTREPEAPHYDPAGVTFAIRDPEGNSWSIGSYAGERARLQAVDRGPGSVWAGVFYSDAPGGIRFLVDTLGFEERLVVTEPEGSDHVVHSQFAWPEGGIVSLSTYDPDNIYSVAPGDQRLYVVSSDPRPIYDRCVAAGLEVVQEPYTPDYDPDGMGFGVRDPEGNIWSIGTYAGE